MRGGWRGSPSSSSATSGLHGSAFSTPAFGSPRTPQGDHKRASSVFTGASVPFPGSLTLTLTLTLKPARSRASHEVADTEMNTPGSPSARPGSSGSSGRVPGRSPSSGASSGHAGSCSHGHRHEHVSFAPDSAWKMTNELEELKEEAQETEDGITNRPPLTLTLTLTLIGN